MAFGDRAVAVVAVRRDKVDELSLGRLGQGEGLAGKEALTGGAERAPLHLQVSPTSLRGGRPSKNFRELHQLTARLGLPSRPCPKAAPGFRFTQHLIFPPQGP